MWRITAGKQQTLQRQVWAIASAHRRTFAAAATSRQKRGLKENSLKGSDNTPPPPASSLPETSSSTSGGGTAMLLGGSGMALAAGAAYMYSTGALDVNSLGVPLSDPPKPATTTVAVKEEAAQASEEKPSTAKEEAPAAETAVAESKKTGPNRVTQIDMPAEMMNKTVAPLTTAGISHPANGNRVAMDIVPPKPAKKEKSKKKKKDAKKESLGDTSLTNEAIQQLQFSANTAAAKSMIQSHQSLWSALDASFFDDLEDLSKAELKSRIVKLVAELKQRTQWEAVRLKEFMAMKEKEVAQQ